MRRFFRLLVAAFLALAVPLQGLAGVTMASCAGGHAHAAQHAAGHGHADGAVGASDAASAGHHAGMAHEHAMGHDHAAVHGHDESGAPDKHNCAACAACCNLSAAPVPAVAAAAPDRPSSLPIPFFGSAHASVQARGLERPPSLPLLG